jgi:penicillin-binding protein 1C
MRLLGWIAAALSAVLLAPAIALAVPSFEAVRAAHRPSDVALVDRHGTPIQWQRIDDQVRRGPWVSLADISPALREAIVLGEDRRFWAHGGVDWRALAASAWANAWNSRTRGASTVTMQLAGLLDEELARPAGGRGVGQKLGQIVRAKELEAGWSKAQILEAYLNAVPLRGEVVGISAAAQLMFGKHASGLDAPEAAVLAALVRAPNANAAAVARRACDVLKLMVPLGSAQPAAAALPASEPCQVAETTAQQALSRRAGALLGEALAPHLARHMARQSGEVAGAAAPKVLASTLDARIQRLARAALRRQLAELRGREVEDGAVVVLDNASGEVLAWVGSAGATSAAAEVDAVLARRQPGSTLKPFVYALALERRLLTAASIVEDSPLELSAGAGLYAPRNYDQSYRGGVSVRQALAGSLNVPAVRVAAMLEPEALFERLNRAGLRLTHNAGYHGHALALGSADVTLLDLSNAYRMLALGGLWSAPRWWAAGSAKGMALVQKEREAREARVFAPEAAWLIGDILADPAARALSFGLDSPLVTRGFAAVKTGTSKDMRDNWCIGFTDRFTVGVWVGNASGRPMHNVSGVAGAAPVWRELVMALHEPPFASPSKETPPPAALQAQAGEWYLSGTAPAPEAGSTVRPRAGAFGIESPRDGMVLVLDPEIPPAAQRLVLRGAAGDWWLDGQRLGRGTRLEWLPRPGVHVLERHDAAGVERVRFEVRAAPRPAAPATGRAPARPAPAAPPAVAATARRG